ncbi:MAG: ABC transporter substrate-binding protein, partial [Nitrososphaerales archaeon]
MKATRAISTVVAAVIIVVILVIAGIGGYYAISGKGSTSVVTSVVTQGGSTVTQGGSTVTQGGSTVTNVVTSTAVSTVSQTSATSAGSSTTSGSSGSGPKTGGTLNVAVDTQESTLDPLNSLIIPFSGTADYGIYEGLIFFGPNGAYIPGLATSWTSLNATNWIFNLRQGVVFHDGTQFNASVVKFVFDRSISSSTATKTMYGLIQSTTVLNNSAVQIRLWSNSTYGYFLSRIASDFALIYSPSAFIRDGNSSTTYGLNPVGTGPFEFKEWVQNDHLTMVANPNYWGPKPYIQTVIIHIIPDPTSRLLALQSGEIQLADVPPQYASQLNTSSTIVGIGPFNRVIDMDINVNNMSNPAFQDVRVRQALNYAINRTALAAAVYYGFAQPATGGPLVPGPLYAPYYSNYSMYPAGGNITKAKQLLAAAGYSSGLNVSIDFSGTFVNSLTIAT